MYQHYLNLIPTFKHRQQGCFDNVAVAYLSALSYKRNDDDDDDDDDGGGGGGGIQFNVIKLKREFDIGDVTCLSMKGVFRYFVTRQALIKQTC